MRTTNRDGIGESQVALTIDRVGPADAPVVAALVMALTDEICARSGAEPFPVDTVATTSLCQQLIEKGHYTVLLGRYGRMPVAVATIAETHALYAGGVIGVVQEFFVRPEVRSTGVGAAMIEAVGRLGTERGWACIELCTPPLPVFEGALRFYERNGFKAVGGRKMRRRL